MAESIVNIKERVQHSGCSAGCKCRPAGKREKL